jgi:Dolichyl-phosphate-mannose-protein mannosyltransferase
VSVSRSASQRWGRRLLFAAILLLSWAAIVAATGGFRIEIGPLRFSSRNATRIAYAGAILALVAWRLAYREHVRQAARALPGLLTCAELRFATATERLGRLAGPVAWAIALALFVAGIFCGSRVAGGADAFGYLSEAALLGSGRLAIDQSFAAALPWPNAAGSFVPLAYQLGAGGVMGPTVAPGLPLLMAFAATLSACGPYLVVPLCGALLVLATWWLGRRLFGAGPALAAAVLVACSPVVAFESLVVMADVPAAAFWISALAVALQRTGVSTLGAGVLAGIAILIRPNLLPLAVFPWLLAVCRVSKARVAGARTALFALGSVPAALVIAFINHRVQGSALTSGYGDLGSAFALAHAAINLRLYSGWWLESQGIAGVLFVLALWPWRAGMRREVAILIAYALSGVLLYLFYLPFDQWWYLRFMIPAIPIVLLLCAEAIAWLTQWSTIARTAALMALLVIGGTHAIHFADSKDILTNAEAEKRRYLDTAVHIDATLPSDAVVLAMQHSGSIRYYSGRLTMRWDVLDAGSLDAAVAALHARGVPVYAAIESWEEEDFRRRFAGQRSIARLDSGAVAKSADGELRVYALNGDRAETRATAIIPRHDSGCVEGSRAFITPGAVRRLSTATPETASAPPPVPR